MVMKTFPLLRNTLVLIADYSTGKKHNLGKKLNQTPDQRKATSPNLSAPPPKYPRQVIFRFGVCVYRPRELRGWSDGFTHLKKLRLY